MLSYVTKRLSFLQPKLLHLCPHQQLDTSPPGTPINKTEKEIQLLFSYPWLLDLTLQCPRQTLYLHNIYNEPLFKSSELLCVLVVVLF